ncbi:hypothetical protein ASD07_20305 [Duganella sp. Root336D2]|nr:hypothetical protein ASD07_20305 [Duganella sp. Root336D2]
MAIWQFLVALIPRQWAERDGNSPEMLYDGEGYNDTSSAWQNNQPNVNLAELISGILPPAESWSDSLRIWGDERRSDIQVGYEGDNVESVMVRIDAREDTAHLCSRVIELASVLDCVLFFPAERAIIALDLAALSGAVQKSRAARFAAAPHEFIEQLSRTSSNES